MAWNFFKEALGSLSTIETKNSAETKPPDVSKELVSSSENIEAEIEKEQKEIRTNSAILSQEIGIFLRMQLTQVEKDSVSKHVQAFLKHASLAFLVLFTFYQIQTAHAKAKAEKEEFYNKYPEFAEVMRRAKEMASQHEEHMEDIDSKIAQWKEEAAALDSE